MSIIKSNRILCFFEICWTSDSLRSVGVTEIEAYSILNLLDILLDICKMPQKIDVSKVLKPLINLYLNVVPIRGTRPASYRKGPLDLFYSLCVASLLQLLLIFDSSVVALPQLTTNRHQRKKHGLTVLFRWCLFAESNHGHRDFQSLALPTELNRQIKK